VHCRLDDRPIVKSSWVAERGQVGAALHFSDGASGELRALFTLAGLAPLGGGFVAACGSQVEASGTRAKASGPAIRAPS